MGIILCMHASVSIPISGTYLYPYCRLFFSSCIWIHVCDECWCCHDAFTHPLQSIWFIVFYQVISYFEDNVIYPRVVGNSVGLPGLWVLLSIFVFGDLWGVFGMVMAVPTTACLYVFFAEFINNRLRKKRLRIENDTLVQEEIHDEKTIS